MTKKTQIEKFQDAVRQLEEAPDEKTFDAALKAITRTLGQDASNEAFEEYERTHRRKPK
jgi:hypothetical protein